MKQKILKTFDLNPSNYRKLLKEHYFLLSVFWLLTISIILSCFVWNFFDSIFSHNLLNDLYKINHSVFYISAIVLITILSGIFIFFIKPKDKLEIQKIHNQPSWIFYAYWGIINSFFLSALYLRLEQQKLFWVLLLIPLIIIKIKFLCEVFSKEKDLSFKNFASGSVGLNDDALEFKQTAGHTTDGLLKLNNYVNVVGLYGGLGFGKSSYARMVLEGFDCNKTLYTYISLTETNEAKDFSSLFSERWLETLSERYPKIDITVYLPFMDSILRESGNGIFSGILRAVSFFDRGLHKTKALFFDEFYSKREKFTSARVGKLFGNIPEIKESLWVILIDELERAQLDEIYRVVEIVERFKNEGRSGLPTKLLFLFCISEPDLGNYLDSFSDKDPRARLLKTFFYEDPKSISHKIFLPPVKPAIKEKFVIELFDKIIEREQIKHQGTVSPNSISDPSRSFMKDEDALNHIIYLVEESSPRTIARIVSALDFFYGSFKNKAGELDKNAIRFSDIIALEYIKIKYPYLIDFFSKTIGILVNQSERNNLNAYFVHQRLKENKTDLIGWIESVTDKKFTDKEKPEILNMVGLVMYYYFDFIKDDRYRETKDQYFNSTSYPEKMQDYLTLTSEGTETAYRKNNSLYQQHQEGRLKVKEMENGDLVSYARFIYDIPDAKQEMNIEVLDELTKRIINKTIAPKPLAIGDSVYDDALYQFIFQIVSITEKERNNDIASDNLKKAFDFLKKLLSSSINVGAKYIILNSLANNERGSGSSVHMSLVATFNKLYKFFPEEIKKLINGIFLDSEKRYFKKGARGVIYKTEENFFFLMYQGWSGSKDNLEEINKIRNTAKRGLKNYPEAIKIYWDRYPYQKGWTSFQDVIGADRFFLSGDKNTDLYMPIDNLIKATKQAKIKDEEIISKMKFWSKIKDDPAVKQRYTVEDDQSTLRSFLTRAGLLTVGN